MRQTWEYLPWDDRGYFSSAEFLKWDDEAVRTFIADFEHTRYHGWRNHNNLWRSTLMLDTTHGKRILDYGCGFGIEALQFCRSDNRVTLFDIFASNMRAAKRVLALSGYKEANDSEYDIFYSNGVLHHTPEMRRVLQGICGKLPELDGKLAKNGEIRLLLYSDRAWKLTTGTEAKMNGDVRKHPEFAKYVAAMDASGEYADWYSQEKLEKTVGDFLTLVQFNYITPDGRYATAILRPCA